MWLPIRSVFNFVKTSFPSSSYSNDATSNISSSVGFFILLGCKFCPSVRRRGFRSCCRRGRRCGRPSVRRCGRPSGFRCGRQSGRFLTLLRLAFRLRRIQTTQPLIFCLVLGFS